MTRPDGPRRLAQPSQLLLGELLRRNASRTPYADAVRFEGETRTYGELEARAERLAAALLARGVRPGDRVAVWLFNGLEIVESISAVHKLGAVAVPINFRLTADESTFIIEDCDACGLIADRRLPQVADGGLGVGWELVVGPGPGSSYEEAIETTGALDGAPYVDDDDAAAFVIYTSGTTGRPKGAVLTHKNLVVNTANWIFEVGVTRKDTYLFGFPLFHIGGLVGLYPFLHIGRPVIILASLAFDAGRTLDLIESSGSTVCAFVPAQWQLLTTLSDAPGKLSGVRRAIWGGSPASRPLLEQMCAVLPPDAVISTFGQTEVTANATFLGPGDAIRKLGSVGRPSPTMEYRIVDDSDRDVARGEIGEIVYRGPTVMREYLGRPEATAEAFRGGWFHSGDLVREDEDGYLYVVDRKNDMIITGGENVYPAEVERVLAEHPAVQEATVFGVANARWGETPIAYVVLRASATATPEELLELCSKRLARYKHPTQIAIVADLPRNPAGKVLKRVLREQFEHNQGAANVQAG